ncbi:hypothetical protein BSLG_005311 [Batrachochytrium salamandrivorans]|nr:hypothetical protein BSLG_005311 [Batrachochytrium salamandrivorans]
MPSSSRRPTDEELQQAGYTREMLVAIRSLPNATSKKPFACDMCSSTFQKSSIPKSPAGAPRLGGGSSRNISSNIPHGYGDHSFPHMSAAIPHSGRTTSTGASLEYAEERTDMSRATDSYEMDDDDDDDDSIVYRAPSELHPGQAGDGTGQLHGMSHSQPQSLPSMESETDATSSTVSASDSCSDSANRGLLWMSPSSATEAVHHRLPFKNSLLHPVMLASQANHLNRSNTRESVTSSGGGSNTGNSVGAFAHTPSYPRLARPIGTGRDRSGKGWLDIHMD